MQTKLKQGLYPWSPPVGYLSLHFKKRDEKKTSPDIPHPEIFPLIQRALLRYAEGNRNPTEIALFLDELGLKRIRGLKTTRQLVNNMLGTHLAFYAGILIDPWSTPPKQEYIGQHQPMIDRETYYIIQAIRDGKPRVNARKVQQNPEFPLRKFVRCGICGNPFTASAPKGNGGRYLYYHCRSKECPRYGKSIAKDKFEGEFLEFLRLITPKEGHLALFKETVIDVWKEKGQLLNAEAEHADRKLEGIRKKRDRIFEMREDGSYSKEEFMERKEAVEIEIATARIELSEARIEQYDIEAAVSFAVQYVKSVDRQWFDASPETQVKFQKLIFPAGISYSPNKGFGTTELGLLYQVNTELCNDSARVVVLTGLVP